MQVNLPSHAAKASLLAIALALALPEAGAMGLGEPIVRSYIGSPLHIEIPLHLLRGETVNDNCVSLLPISAAVEGAPVLPLSVKVVGGNRPYLLVQSERVAREPYATMRVQVQCSGAALLRDFSVLLDPPPQQATALPGGQATGVDADPPDLPAEATQALASAETPAPTRIRNLPRTGSNGPAATSVPHAAAPARSQSQSQSHLRLETGSLLARRTTGLAGNGGEGMPALRLDMHLDAPPPVTASLVAQRAQLRDLRSLMLSGDDTLERLLSLQTQVGTLETQLKALQGGAPAPGTPVPAPVVTGAAPGTAPAAPASPLGAAGGAPASPDAPAVPGAVPAPAAVAGLQPPAPATDSAAPAANPPAPPPPQVKVAVRKPAPPPPPAEDFDWTVPAASTGAALLVLGGALYYLRRRKLAGSMETVAIHADEDVIADLPGGEAAPAVVGSEPRPGGKRASAATDRSQSAEESARSAYLAQRFPEIAAGLINLQDPDSVVNGARLYAESGDLDRASELLEAAIHHSASNDVRPWLGLFEVLRLSRQSDGYAGLLDRFRERFKSSRYLPEVLAAGRQIDPHRPEFAAPPGEAAPEIGPDGTSWLNPELDFVPQALAQDLHDTLMAELADDELTLSPMEDRRT